MKLPVLRPQQYLSPSGLSEWELCEYKYYLKRMANVEYVNEPQSMAAAIGSAFDALISYKICQELGLAELPEYSLDKMLKDSVQEYNYDEAVGTATKLVNTYVRLGCLESIMNEGISEIHPATKKNITDGVNEVPIYVKPDLRLKTGRTLEFKVSGAKSASGVSPKPGYLRCRYSNGKYKGPHDRSTEYFENIDPGWAAQLSIYHWSDVNMFPFKDIPIAVENIAVRLDTVACASYRSNVSAEFQAQLWEKMYKAWKRIEAGDIPDPMADPMKCNAWGSLCVFSGICPSYKASNESELAGLFKK